MPQLDIIGGKDCDGVTKTPAHMSKVALGDNITLTAVHTPCHTQDSVCWFAEDAETLERAVFTGDTLFTAGCGRFFEGTAAEMHEALNVRLAGLPDDTKVYVSCWGGMMMMMMMGEERWLTTGCCCCYCCKVRTRIHKGQCPVRTVRVQGRRHCKTRGLRGEECADDGRVHHWRRKEAQRVYDGRGAWVQTRRDERDETRRDETDDLLMQEPELQAATGETEPVKVMGRLRAMKDAF